MKYILSRTVVLFFLGCLISLHAHASPVTKEGEACLDRWDVKKAMEIALKCVDKEWDNAESFKLLGLVYFYSGDYEKAISPLQKACEMERWNHYRKNLLDFVKGTAEAASKLKPYESEHFIVRLDERDLILKDYALRALELGYAKISNELGFFVPDKIIVEIYPSTDDFNFASTLTKEQLEVSGAIGICKFNRIMIVSPRCLAFGYRWLDSLVHEFVHYVIVRSGAASIPLWLNEGMAKYFETTWRSEKSLYLVPAFGNFLSDALKENKWVSFEKMRYGMPNLESQQEVALAFAEVSSAVDYIITSYGMDRLRALIASFARGADEKKAMKEILGTDEKKLAKNWKKFIAGSNLDRVDRIVLDNFKLKSEEVDELDQYVGMEAQGFVRLGDKFRRAGRNEIALAEYEKALNMEKSNPVILNKMGKVLFSAGDFVKAEENFKEALRISPNMANIYTNLGDMYFNQARFKEALDQYVQSNEINPFNPLIHKNMGVIYHSLGDRDNALKELRITEILSPGDVEVRSWLFNLEKRNN